MKALKAPKDMTAGEFVALLESRSPFSDGSSPYTIRQLRDILEEPAPELFTSDQLATMREYQLRGVNYCANNSGLALLFYKSKPTSKQSHWHTEDGSALLFTVPPELSFLGDALDDNEVICFADYAPL